MPFFGSQSSQNQRYQDISRTPSIGSRPSQANMNAATNTALGRNRGTITTREMAAGGAGNIKIARKRISRGSMAGYNGGRAARLEVNGAGYSGSKRSVQRFRNLDGLASSVNSINSPSRHSPSGLLADSQRFEARNSKTMLQDLLQLNQSF